MLYNTGGEFQIHQSVCTVKQKTTIYTFFISCKCLDIFWNTCSNTFKTCGIQHNMRDLKHIVLGYKFIYKEYTGINTIINLIGFCIFKSHVISEKRSTPYNIFKLLKYELFILCTYLLVLSHHSMTNCHYTDVKDILLNCEQITYICKKRRKRLKL